VELRPIYPVALIVAGRRCLVVGGGHIAHRKALGLVEAGAEVTVVAPEVVPELEQLVAHVERRPYRATEAASYWLVCSATGNAVIDGAVYADAEEAGVLVNAADDPEHCSYYLPANLRLGPVTISVSTGGASPGLAVWLRDRLATELDVDLERLAELATGARTAIRAVGAPTEGLAWGALLDDLADALRSGSSGEPERAVDDFVDASLARATPRDSGAPAPG
jgi:siroheme synthase-like protein